MRRRREKEGARKRGKEIGRETDSKRRITELEVLSYRQRERRLREAPLQEGGQKEIKRERRRRRKLREERER